MGPSSERILIVESDEGISDLIARQALLPLGYATLVEADAAGAIRQAVQAPLDLILADLSLPGLSGKDLLTALASQGIAVPVVVIARKGEEQGVIQAFRLGAVDVLSWPARDAEVVRVVERALQQTRESRERRKLGQQLETTHQELERNLRELRAILDIGRAVISVTDQRKLFERILDGALQLSQSDAAWLLVRDERTRSQLLVASRGLPAGWPHKLNEPMDDGISSLVALSGETLSIHGAPLEKFRVAALGKSAIVLPLKVQAEVIGLLVAVRKADREFGPETQTLLEAVADFACISLVQARLFRAVEQAQDSARQTDKMRSAVLDGVKLAMAPLEGLAAGQLGALSNEQVQAVRSVREALRRLARIVGQTIAVQGTDPH